MTDDKGQRTDCGFRISDFGLRNKERLKAQGARPKVKEFRS
jgi:hypothetical protein